jgi:CubicO group peptidase (beta-lactamase class C family)
MLCLRTILLTLLVLIAMGLPTPSHSQPSSKSYTINSDTLASIDRDLRDGLYGKISGLAIYSGAKLIFEKYYGFNSRSTLHPISSVTKSITSLMVGICIDRGLLASVDIPVYHYFPEYRDIFMKDSLKRRITIRHLLNQTAGLRWDEWTTHYSYAGNQLIDITQRDTSWIDVFFRLPTECDPGLEFRYNSLASQVVKEVLCRAAGMDYPVMVDEYLLKPLGINAYHWDQYPLNGVPAWGASPCQPLIWPASACWLPGRGV